MRSAGAARRQAPDVNPETIIGSLRAPASTWGKGDLAGAGIIA